VTPSEAHASQARREVPGRSFDAFMERVGQGSEHVEPPPQTAAPMPGGAALPELRVAARAIPPLVWSGRLAGAGAVELAFGRELRIELREGTGGVEIQVRVCPSLARAARADLPALLRTLRERGVQVARAEVRGGAQAKGGDAAGEGPGR
jgi:hypothetical protein